MQPFEFTSDISSLKRESSRVLEVPMELSDKDALFRWYADALEMPEYFGANWDALDDCLRDLSWVQERRLVLFHRDIPLAENAKDRNSYVEVLVNAANDWKPWEDHELVVAFDPACKLKLRTIIRES